MSKTTAIYLNSFPKKTYRVNFLKSYFKSPATRVSGSPTIGSHEKNNITGPYFLKLLLAFSVSLSENLITLEKIVLLPLVPI